MYGSIAWRFAGAAFYGVYYAGSKVIPVKQNKTTISSTANTGNNSSGTQVSSTDTKKEIKATVMDVSELVDSVITSVVAISGEVTSYNYGFSEASSRSQQSVVQE